MTTPQQENIHKSVLLQEVLQVLDPRPEDTVLDGTLGGGGHARALAERLGHRGRLIGLDMDEAAIQKARQTLSGVKCTLNLECANFRQADTVLAGLGIKRVDKALLDLGYSSNQLELSGRGFSFLTDEPLLMTLKKDPGEDDITAREIVNTWSEEAITNVLTGYGEERYARRIAKRIVAAREEAPIERTGELVALIRSAVPAMYARGRTHFATRTFQALRIAANDELRALEDGLERIFHLLAPGGVLAVISFHSLEDRIVKRFFKTQSLEGAGELLMKKPITPSTEELRGNPRARSAKLRAIRRTI